MFTRVDIQASADGEKRPAWRDALLNLTDADLIKREATVKRVSAVYRATLLGSAVAIKVIAPLGVRNTLFRPGLVGTHARKQWAGAKVLRAAGVETAEPFVLAKTLWHDPVTQTDRLSQTVVVEWLDGRTLLEAIAAAPKAERPAIARAAGRLTARLTGSMILNRDHKPSNIIVLTPKGNADPRLAVIDTVAIRTGVLADRASVRMLRDLCLEPIGVGHPPTARDIAAFCQGLRDAGFWTDNTKTVRAFRSQLLRTVSEAIAEHGDPTPKVNPLTGEHQPQAPANPPS